MKKKNISLFLFYSCYTPAEDTIYPTGAMLIEQKKNLKTKEEEIEYLKNKNSIPTTESENKNKELEENLKKKEREIEDLKKELQNIKNQNYDSGTILEKLKKEIKRLFLEKTPLGEFINNLPDEDKIKRDINIIEQLYFFLKRKSPNDLVNKLFEGEFLQGKKIIIKGGLYKSIEEAAVDLKEEEIIYIFDQIVFGENFFMRIYIEKGKKYLDFCFGKNILIKYEIEFREKFLKCDFSIFRKLIFNSEFDELKNVLKPFFSKIEIVK